MADETTDLEVSSSALYDEVQRLRTEVTRLNNLVANHVHRYAGARTAGGGATSLDAPEDGVNELAVVGLGTLDGALGVNPDVLMEGGTVRAETFVGNLDGTATAAGKLAQSFAMTFTGDVDGVAGVDGASTVEAKLRLAPTGVLSGEYGPVATTTLAIGGTFTVPQLVIADDGRVTWATNKQISIPANIAVAGTTNSLQFDDEEDLNEKLYLVGANIQGVGVRTFSDKGVFINRGRLHTNELPVVDTESAQAIVNKTYEGFTLGEACARGVDESVQGTAGSGDLATSNALAEHVHSYAAALEADGAAIAVEVDHDRPPTGQLVVDTGDGLLASDEQVRLEEGALVAGSVTAEETLNIPGGSLWIDTSARVVDVSEYNSGSGDTTADHVYTFQYDDQGFAYTVEEILQRDDTRLTLLEHNVSALDGSMTAVRTDMDACIGTVHGYGLQIDDLRLVDEQIGTQLTELDDRLNAAAAALGAADALLANHGRRIDTLETLVDRVGNLETRMDAAEALTRFIPGLRGDVAGAQASITELTAALAALRATMDGHSATLTNLALMEGRVGALEDAAARVDTARFILGRGGVYTRDLRLVFGEDVEAAARSVSVLVLDEVATSRTAGMYVDASAVTSVGRSGSMVTVVNESGAQLQCMIIVR